MFKKLTSGHFIFIDQKKYFGRDLKINNPDFVEHSANSFCLKKLSTNHLFSKLREEII